MNLKAQYQILFSYHWHTIKRLLEFAEKVDHQDYFFKPADGSGSIHEKLLHNLRANHAWRQGLNKGSQQRPLRRKNYSNLADLKTGFEIERSAYNEMLDSWMEEDLQQGVTLTRPDGSGAEITFVLWRILQHLILHGMQHHAEIAQMLTNLGHSPGNLDFIFFDE